MLAPKTTKNQHFSRLPASDRNCPPKTIAYHNIQLMNYTALLRTPSTARYLKNDEKWRQQNDRKEYARARAWNDKLYGATFRHMYLWEKSIIEYERIFSLRYLFLAHITHQMQ